jgi:hypothetical protein
MYIRRKVFTKFQTESGEERYFSTTEYTMTEDSEGIRYFSKCDDDNNSKEDEHDKPKKKSVAKKIALGAGITAGTTLAGAKGYQLLKKGELKRNGFYEMNKLDKAGSKLDDKIKQL